MYKKLIIKQIDAEETWLLRHSVMWPDKPLEFVKLEEDKKGFHFGGYVNGNLISIVSLFIKNNEGQFRKLATEENYQGNGYATLLLKYVFEFLEQKRVTRIWCNARANKTDFYKKFGMVITENTYFKGGIDFVIMEKNI